MSKAPTIDDIARMAGVSPSTVSRVLTGSKRVAEDKRALVLAAIAQNQYRPNSVARGLARGRSMTVGVVVQNITSPFFSQILDGIEQALTQRDYQPMFASTRWHAQAPAEEGRALQLLLDRRVDGMLVLGGQIEPHYLHEVAAQLPLIVIGRRIAGLECLFVDNSVGAYRATRFLLGLNHTRIAHITGIPGHPDATDRYAGYCRALVEAGIALNPQLVVEGQFTEESGRTAVERLLAQGERFSAIFAANDQIAYGAMQGLAEHGFRLPQDVSFVGFDDQHHSAYTLPSLTTVRQPAFQFGQAGAAGLLRMIDGEPADLPQYTTELIIRKSAIHAPPS